MAQRMPKKIFKIFIPIVIIVISSYFFTISNKEKNINAEKVEEMVKEVGMIEIKKEKMPTLSEFSGTLQPFEEVIVSFELGGTLLSLNKKEGDLVSVGDVLAVLDDKDYQEKLQQAQASVRQADAGLKQVMMGARTQEIQQAKSTVDKLTTLYQKTLDSYKKTEEDYQLLKVSKTDMDNAKYTLQMTENDLEVAKQAYSIALSGARSEVKEQTQAGYDLASSGRNQVELILEKTKLKAPINGTLIQKFVTNGQLVGAGTPIYKIGDVSNFKVILPVPDYEISNWRIGDNLDVVLYNNTRAGVVTNILPTTNQGTGTVGVEIKVENSKADWISGQIVRCIHKVESIEGIFVPVSAVINTGNGTSYVFVSKNNIAIQTKVKTGILLNNKLEIVEGLKEGDLVVSKGSSRLFGNEKISRVEGDTK